MGFHLGQLRVLLGALVAASVVGDDVGASPFPFDVQTCTGISSSQEWWNRTRDAGYDASVRPNHALVLATGRGGHGDPDVVEIQFRL
ncbi:polynucleotide 5'-hydroxyl-kinase [Aureococcus anophagefferens]|nr:polynucleotide 5'-hydroxyl-kinase [Aureococcus anophagefferens]